LLNSLYIISNIIIACYIKYKYFYRNLMKGIYEEKYDIRPTNQNDD